MKSTLLNINLKKINANGSEKTVWHKSAINYIKPNFKILEVGIDINSFTCSLIYKSIICQNEMQEKYPAK